MGIIKCVDTTPYLPHTSTPTRVSLVYRKREKMAKEEGKPRVLITGGKRISLFTIIIIQRSRYCTVGVGFIGRNFVEFLVENQLASKIRVVDKVPPATGWLNDRHKVF